MATTTVTSTRASFVIYRDEPISTPVVRSKPKTITNILGSSSSTSSTNSNINTIRDGSMMIPTSCDKENIDPFTGRRLSPEDKLAKKRKPSCGTVLAAKPVISKSTVLKDATPELKKRKLSSSKSKSNSSSSSSHSKERKKRERARSVLKAVEQLPKVLEEEEEAITVDSAVPVPTNTNRDDIWSTLRRQEEQERVTQALIDARCYELTVLPLADVSTAYCQSCDSPSLEEHGEKLQAVLKEESVLSIQTETQTKEQLVNNLTAGVDSPSTPSTPSSKSSPSSSSSTSSSQSTPSRRAGAAAAAAATPAFSTPERMRIYNAFTFSSPSLSGRRYAATRRDGGDADKNLKLADWGFEF